MTELNQREGGLRLKAQLLTALTGGLVGFEPKWREKNVSAWGRIIGELPLEVRIGVSRLFIWSVGKKSCSH